MWINIDKWDEKETGVYGIEHTFSFSFFFLIDEPIEIWFFISSSICLSFFVLSSKLKIGRNKKKKRKENYIRNGRHCFVCSMSSYIPLKSVLSLLSRREAPYLYLSMSTNEKNIYIRERERERPWEHLFFCFTTFSLWFIILLLFFLLRQNWKRKKKREKDKNRWLSILLNFLYDMFLVCYRCNPWILNQIKFHHHHILIKN